MKINGWQRCFYFFWRASCFLSPGKMHCCSISYFFFTYFSSRFFKAGITAFLTLYFRPCFSNALLLCISPHVYTGKQMFTCKDKTVGKGMYYACIYIYKTHKKVTILFPISWGHLFVFGFVFLMLWYSVPSFITSLFSQPVAFRSLLQKVCLVNNRSNVHLWDLSFSSAPQSLIHFRILIPTSITNL